MLVVELLEVELEAGVLVDDFVAGIGLSLGMDAPFGDAVGTCAEAEKTASNTLARQPVMIFAK